MLRGKILENLANSLPFANILPTNTYLPLSVLTSKSKFTKYFPPILGDKPIRQYFPRRIIALYTVQEFQNYDYVWNEAFEG